MYFYYAKRVEGFEREFDGEVGEGNKFKGGVSCWR